VPTVSDNQMHPLLKKAGCKTLVVPTPKAPGLLRRLLVVKHDAILRRLGKRVLMRSEWNSPLMPGMFSAHWHHHD
jgi:hypothetical protein